jgi:hypothetical protein
MPHARLRRPVSAVVAVLLASLGWAHVPLTAAAEDPALKIVVLEGEDGVNIIEKKTAVKPVVEVRDRNNLPVAGAVVIFSIVGVSAARGGGGEAIFANGTKMVTVTTNASGRAVAGELQALSKGTYQVQIQAFNHGQVASTTLTQTNYLTEAEAADAAKAKADSKNAKSQQQNSESNQASQSSNASSSSSTTSATTSAATSTVATAAPVAAAATAATATTTASTAGAAGGGGMSALAVTGLAAGAAAGGYATYKVVQEAKAKDCTSDANQAIAELDTENQICGDPRSSFAQCQAAAQRTLNAWGTFCTCNGGIGSNEDPALIQELRSDAAQLGLTWPSSCR